LDNANAIEPLGVPLDQKNIEYWTTREARDRCLRIVSKVGGSKEKQRIQGLLFDAFSPNGAATATDPELDADYPLPAPDTLEKAETSFWESSRFPHKYLPLIPLHFYPGPSSSDTDPSSTPASSSHSSFDPVLSAATSTQDLPPFFRSLHTTCTDILEYEKHTRSKGGPRGLKGSFGLGPSPPNNHHHNNTNNTNPIATDVEDVVEDETESVSTLPTSSNSISGFPRATITKANPRLTAHTVQSLAWGSALG
jgi:hypothetical protein